MRYALSFGKIKIRNIIPNKTRLTGILINEIRKIAPEKIDAKTNNWVVAFKISGDSALASKVLRLVNSSYYGFPRRIATITHAVVILGFNTVRNLTTSLGVLNAFDAKGQKTALDRDKFWAHGLGTAVAAGVIARRKNIAAKMVEEVFIGGLLHDLTGGYRIGIAVSLACVLFASTPFWSVPALRNFR